MKNIIILGYGEIGKAIHKLYHKDYNVCKIDKDWQDEIEGKIHVLNVCIPYSTEFVNIIKSKIESFKPKLTIIHSTVAPGTTEKIATNANVVHSPIRGVHPNLYEGLKTFVKYIGYVDEEAKKLAESHFEELDLKYKSVQNPTYTELAKLYSTTYYGLCIAFHGEMKKHFDMLGLDFDIITDWNNSYNDGYKELKPNVLRPVLFPPEKIGGHCVIPNTEILSSIFESKVFELILSYAP